MPEPAHRPPPPLFHSIVLDPLRAFTRMEAAGGIVLFGGGAPGVRAGELALAPGVRAAVDDAGRAAIRALGFHASLRQVIDDGLMTIFFFVVGMEIKRELVEGELRKLRQALLPAIAARAACSFRRPSSSP